MPHAMPPKYPLGFMANARPGDVASGRVSRDSEEATVTAIQAALMKRNTK